jgi:hypothetical protein
MALQKTMLLAALLMMLCVSSTQVLAQASATPPAKRNKIVFDGDLGALLAQLANKYQVNMSLEPDPAKAKAKANIKIDFWFDTLNDILDGIVLAAPAYRWRNQDGFIDVYPHEAGSVLLETVVSELQVDNNGWLAASQALTSSPEVVNQMKTLGMVRRDLERQRPPATLFSLKLNNVTLRRALHEITVKSNNRFWIFERYGKDGRFFSIINAPF